MAASTEVVWTCVLLAASVANIILVTHVFRKKTIRIFLISISVIQFLGITIFWLGEKVFITLYSSSGSYEHFNTIKKKAVFIYRLACM